MAPFRFVAITAVVIAAFLGVFSLALAAAPATPECPPASSTLYCIVAPSVHSEMVITDATHYSVTNEVSRPFDLYRYFYDVTGTLILTETARGLFANESYNFCTSGGNIPRTFSGTLVLTSTEQFTVQVIDPVSGLCSNNVGQWLYMDMLLNEGTTCYTLANNEFRPPWQTHDTYRNGSFYVRQQHELAGFGIRL